MTCQYLQAFRAEEFFDLVDGNVSRENVKHAWILSRQKYFDYRLSDLNIGNFIGFVKYFVFSWLLSWRLSPINEVISVCLLKLECTSRLIFGVSAEGKGPKKC